MLWCLNPKFRLAVSLNGFILKTFGCPKVFSQLILNDQIYQFSSIIKPPKITILGGFLDLLINQRFGLLKTYSKLTLKLRPGAKKRLIPLSFFLSIMLLVPNGPNWRAESQVIYFFIGKIIRTQLQRQVLVGL